MLRLIHFNTYICKIFLANMELSSLYFNIHMHFITCKTILKTVLKLHVESSNKHLGRNYTIVVVGTTKQTPFRIIITFVGFNYACK